MKKVISLSLLVGLSFILFGCEASMDYMEEMPSAEPDPMMEELNTESYSEIRENPFILTTNLGVSTFSSDVDTAAYSNVRRFLQDNMMPARDAVRTEEMLNYFDYDLGAPTGDDVFKVTTEMHPAPWNDNHDLLMIGLSTEKIDFEDVPANNLVFLLDVSGSMNNPDKLPLLQSAMKLLVDELRPEDKISIVVYAGAAGVVLDAADGENKEEIVEAIDSLSAGGSTAGGEGINLAYRVALENYIEGGNNRVILGTDGDFNVGTSTVGDLEDLIEEKRESGVYFSVLGFGAGNLKDDKMETLADKGNGVYYYIDSILEAKKVFVSELGATLVTVAKDVKLQIEFNPEVVKGYRLIGYENRVLNYDDFTDDSKDAGDIGAGHEMVVFYEIIRAGSEEVIDVFDHLEQPEQLIYSETNLEDLATLKIRYKNPTNDQVTEMTEVIGKDNSSTLSTNYGFAACVIEFALMLRDSEYKGESSYQDILDRVDNYFGTDENGYRDEFKDLVEIASLLDRNEGNTDE